MNELQKTIFSTKSLFFTAILLSILLGATTVTGLAPLQTQEPADCNANSVSLALLAYRDDGTTFIGSNPVAAGEPVKYRAVLEYGASSTFTACNYEGGSLIITTPDGIDHDVTPISGIPRITENNTFISGLVPYTVDPADVDLITERLQASADYLGGTSLTGSDDDAEASVNLNLRYLAQDLDIKKTALATINTTYDWSLDKSVDHNTADLFDGGSEDFTYTINVTRSVESTEYYVTGTITLTNPSQFVEATVTGISDVLSDDTQAQITCPEEYPFIIPADDTVICQYRALVTDDNVDLNTVNVTTNGDIGGGSATAPVNWQEARMIYNNDEATVEDNNTDEDPWVFTDSGSVEYTNTYSCTEQTYTDYFSTYDVENTAEFVEYDGFDEETVTINCYELDISKTAVPSIHREYEWTIDKQADPTTVTLFDGENEDVDYEIALTKTLVLEEFSVAGVITIHNPSILNATLTSVEDVLPDSTNMSVDCNVTFPYNLVAGDTLECTYNAELPDGDTRTNTATAHLEEPLTSYSATASVDFSQAPVTEELEEVTVRDECGLGIDECEETLQAAPYPADNVEDFDQGTKKDGGDVKAARSVPEQGLALETTGVETQFVTLGYDGTLIVSFNNPAMNGPGPDISVVEDTWSAYPVEQASVYASTDGNDWTLLGTADNTDYANKQTYNDFDLGALPYAAYIKIVDTTDSSLHNSDSDGIEINAVLALHDYTIPCENGLEAAQFSVGVQAVFTCNEEPRGPWIAEDDATINYTNNYDCAQAIYNENGTYMYTVENTATIEETGQSSTETVDVTCYQPPVTKTAQPHIDRDYDWTIQKTVSPESFAFLEGDSDTATYNVSVTKTVGEELYSVTGTINVHNPSTEALTIYSIEDMIDESINADVDCGDISFPYLLGADETLVCNYDAPLPTNDTVINEVTVDFGQEIGLYTATATIDFANATLNETDNSIDVDDTNGESWSFSDSGSHTYDRLFSCREAEYTENYWTKAYPNNATIRGTQEQDSASVTVECWELAVTKTAEPYIETGYNWSINKRVSPTETNLWEGNSDVFQYTLLVTKTLTDTRYYVEGTVHILNPSPLPTNITVEDTINNYGTISLDCGENTTFPYELGAGELLDCTYNEEVDSDEYTLNTVDVLMNDAVPYSANASFSFEQAPVEEITTEEVTVQDTNGREYPLSGNATIIYAEEMGCYERTYTEGYDNYTHTNTARFVEIPGNSSTTVTVNCWEPLINKTAVPDIDEDYTWSIEKTVSPDEWHIFKGDTATSEYTVSVERTMNNSDYAVTGTITVQNPSDTLSLTVTSVEDTIAESIDADVLCPELGVILPGESIECYYNATLTSTETLENSATAHFEETPSVTGKATIDFTNTTPDDIGSTTITVTDTNGYEWVLNSTDNKRMYNETFDCTEVEYLDGVGSYTHDNTATIVENGMDADASVDIYCYTLNVEKTAETDYTRTYEWNITKESETENIRTNTGTPVSIEYAVVVDVESMTDSDYEVAGDITVTNNNPYEEALITELTDTILGAGGSITPDCPTDTVPAGGSITCTYNSSLANNDARTNTAHATMQNNDWNTDGSSSPSGTTYYTGTTSVSFDNPSTVVDETIVVDDSLYGALGSVDADEAPATFNYEYQYTPAEGICGETTLNNTAAFTTTDTQTSGEDDWTIDVIIDCGCTYTQGYWKTHSDPDRKKYDDTWDELTNGPETIFYLSGETWVEVFNNPGKGNPYYPAAHQYMAAYLNTLNDASTTPEVDEAMSLAHTIFSTYTPAEIDAMKNNDEVVKDLRWINDVLTDYNEGTIGPGHCDEGRVYCGDDEVNQEWEECDGTDGVTEGYVCSEYCELERLPYCGDGEVNQENEVCDGDDGVTEGYTCTEDCTLDRLPFCGDGIVNQEWELCDGSAPEGFVCTDDCDLETDITEDLDCVEAIDQGLLYGTIGPDGTATVHNDYTESFWVTLASYEKYDEHIPNQTLYDYQSQWATAEGETLYEIDVPSCSYQIDLVCGDVIEDLGTELYGDRKLDYEHRNGDDYCGEEPFCGNGLIEGDEECDGSAPEGLVCTEECTLELDNQETCDAETQLVMNGGFETPVVTHNKGWNIYPDGTTGLAWSVEWETEATTYQDTPIPDIANVELRSTADGWSAYEGSQYLELDSDWFGPDSTMYREPATTIISQDIPTIPGEEYTMSFAFSPRPNENADENTFDVLINGDVVDTISKAGSSSTDWNVYTYNWTATSNTSTIAFSEEGIEDARGTFLDDVNAYCVPRPAFCGDDEVNQETEECDDGTANGEVPTPAYGETLSYCSNECTIERVPGPYCGDNEINGEEACDGDDLGAEDSPYAYCTQNCELAYEPYCGDGIVNQESEDCDGSAPKGLTCTEECELLGPVKPILECVEDHDSYYTARFGYENLHGTTVEIPVGNENKITGGGLAGNDQGQLTTFTYPAPDHPEGRPGRTAYDVGAFTVDFDGSNLVWTLTGPDDSTRTSTASSNSKACPVDPVCGDGIVNQESEDCDGSDGVTEGYTCTEQCTLESDEVCDPETELIKNGGFETPIVEHAKLWDIYPTGTTGLFWTAEWTTSETNYGGYPIPALANIELHRGVNSWTPFEGSQYAELDSDWYGPDSTQTGEPATISMSQDVDTIPGEEYTLRFAYSPRPNTGLADNNIEVRADGNLLDTINKAGSSTNDWNTYEYSFVANEEATTITFTETGTSNALGSFLDDVSVRCTQPEEPICGDGIINQESEQCDGSAPEGFICTETCELRLDEQETPFCGDGIINQESEECDDGTANGDIPSPAYDETLSYCSNECTLEDIDGPYCGDDIKNGEEECDGSAPFGYECTQSCELLCVETFLEEAPYDASNVEDYDQGLRKDGSAVLAIRSTPEQGLALETGTDENNFFSLGFGGMIIVEFEHPALNEDGDDIKVVEDTWGDYPLETASVYASNDLNNWELLGTADNTVAGPQTYTTFDLGTLPYAKYIKIVDTTNPEDHTSNGDGYDLNAVQALHEAHTLCEETPYCGDGIVNGEEACDGSAPEGYTCTETCELRLDDACEEEQLQAAPYPADSVEDDDQGLRNDGSNVIPERSTPTQGLTFDPGKAHTNFFSLGFEGSLTVGFNNPATNGPGNDILVTEDTWPAYPVETADVYASNDLNNWTFLGTADNSGQASIHTGTEFDLGALPYATYIKIVDTTNNSLHAFDADGFDVNSVEALHDAWSICEETPFCGNGIQEEGEDCDGDDGVIPGYTCTQSCELEFIITETPYCGDDIINQESEECDDGTANGDIPSPGYDETLSYCSNECTLEDIDGPYCGDDIKNGEEECDGTDGVNEGYTCNDYCELEEDTPACIDIKIPESIPAWMEECTSAGYDFGVAKYEWDEDTFIQAEGDTNPFSTSINNWTLNEDDEAISASWNANPGVYVIVKAGTEDDKQGYGTAGIASSFNGKGISHITFCANTVACDEPSFKTTSDDDENNPPSLQVFKGGSTDKPNVFVDCDHFPWLNTCEEPTPTPETQEQDEQEPPGQNEGPGDTPPTTPPVENTQDDEEEDDSIIPIPTGGVIGVGPISSWMWLLALAVLLALITTALALGKKPTPTTP